MEMVRMLTLYQFDSCPFCWKVKALLNYANCEYKTVEVTPFGMKELDFTTHRKVPVLRDNEQVVTESAAIVSYVNETYVHLPSNSDAVKWVEWLDGKLVHFLPPLIHPSTRISYKNFALIMKKNQFGWFKGKMIHLMGAFVMPKVAKKMQAKHTIVDVEAEFLAEIDYWVNDGLQGKDFFGGDQADFIDCSVFGVLHSSYELGVIELAKQHNATFYRWYMACYPLMTTETA
jgi:microsomal prostaglandin-E synthase 2